MIRGEKVLSSRHHHIVQLLSERDWKTFLKLISYLDLTGKSPRFSSTSNMTSRLLDDRAKKNKRVFNFFTIYKNLKSYDI